MSDLTRTQSEGLAFLTGVTEACGYKMRPFSYETINACRLLEMPFFDENAKDRIAAMDSQQMADLTNVFLFIQTAPVPEVARAVRAFCKMKNAGTHEEAWEALMCDRVAPFLATLAPGAADSLVEQFEAIADAGAVGSVAVPPDSKKAKDKNRPEEGTDPGNA